MYRKKVNIFSGICIVLVIILLSGCACGRIHSSEEKDYPVDSNKTDNHFPFIAPEAEDLSENQVEQIDQIAINFYKSAYKKDFSTMKTMMTNDYADAFDMTFSENDGSVKSDGTDLLLELSNYSSEENPHLYGAPYKIDGEYDYMVILQLDNDHVARIGFVSQENDYKVSFFSIQSLSMGDGGTMGSHEK